MFLVAVAGGVNTMCVASEHSCEEILHLTDEFSVCSAFAQVASNIFRAAVAPQSIAQCSVIILRACLVVVLCIFHVCLAVVLRHDIVIDSFWYLVCRMGILSGVGRQALG